MKQLNNLIEALNAYESAGQRLTAMFDEVDAEIMDEVNSVQPSPFPLSFDEFCRETSKWKNDVIKVLANPAIKKFRDTRVFYTITEILNNRNLDHIDLPDDKTELQQTPGYFVYDKGCFIQVTKDGKFWCPISNYDVLADTLQEAERRLYEEHYLSA